MSCQGYPHAGIALHSCTGIQDTEHSSPYLLDEGHEVVGDAAGVLPDPARGVRPHWVEVAQQHHTPRAVRHLLVPQDILHVQLVGSGFRG